jgi:hypothetical protein
VRLILNGAEKIVKKLYGGTTPERNLKKEVPSLRPSVKKMASHLWWDSKIKFNEGRNHCHGFKIPSAKIASLLDKYN